MIFPENRVPPIRSKPEGMLFRIMLSAPRLEPFRDLDVCYLLMSLLPRKGLLAIAAVVDVALQSDGRPISAKMLATRHCLPPRHLESVLQSLVRDGILKGIRGPHGGYELARERVGVTANDILRAAGTVDDGVEEPNSELVAKVVLPVLSAAERAFGLALSQINLDDMTRHAERLNGNAEHKS
jgi:Rrf2 family transcriptional regulator, iron-sulfur cluster assembly transcription factor